MPSGLEDTLAAIVREQVAAALDERLPKYFGQTRLPPRQSPVLVLEEKLLSKQDVAELLKVSDKTVSRRMASGELRPCMTRPIRFAPSEVKRYIAESRCRTVDDVDQIAERLGRRRGP